MQSSSHVKYRASRGRGSKRVASERGTLRCEWCNRRTEIRPGYRWGDLSTGEWLTIAATLSPYFCPRPSCVAGRSETMGAAGRATRVIEELKRREAKATGGNYAADDTRPMRRARTERS